MSYNPVVPSGGLVGWRFLQRTYEVQLETFSTSGAMQRDIAYFEENISNIHTAEALVSDHRLLNVALGAFGLQDDLPNKYFIQRILSDGTSDDDALANRLADDRYKKLSDAFGFGPLALPQTTLSGKMKSVLDQFRFQQFEQAIGEQDETMRIALFAERELGALANGTQSDDAKWFSIMGLPPLRELFETALGLPQSFGQIDIDQQLEIFRDRASSVLGVSSVDEFADSAHLERLVTTYHARAQIDQFSNLTSPASVALTLLQSIQV